MTPHPIDVSVPIHEEMVVYAGDPQPRIDTVAALADGQIANVSRLEMVVHTGTHVDAPAHFLADGAGVDSLPLEALTGPAEVLDATEVEGDVDAAALRELDPPAAERLLLKTRNSRLWERGSFVEDYCGLTADAGDLLVNQGIRLVGIDYLSIAPRRAPVPTHRRLLEAGVVILEGLDLREVEPGPYELICLPVLISDCDGAPARAVLVERRVGDDVA